MSAVRKLTNAVENVVDVDDLTKAQLMLALAGLVKHDENAAAFAIYGKIAQHHLYTAEIDKIISKTEVTVAEALVNPLNDTGDQDVTLLMITALVLGVLTGQSMAANGFSLKGDTA